MNVLIVNNTALPAELYGGTERVIWWLGRELVRLGHRATYLVKEGSSCPFAEVLPYRPSKPLDKQIPDDIDVVHLHFQISGRLKKPCLITHHGNFHNRREFNVNTVFVSRNHAVRNSAQVYVYNGLDPDDYGPVDFGGPRKHLLFLGYAKRPEKNLKACAAIARKTRNVLAVVGGKPAWFRARPWMAYKGFLGGEEKNAAIRESKALLYPVLWPEPFGLAVIEAMYFGCPVFGTRYGSLPELVSPDMGFLSNRLSELAAAAGGWDRYDPHLIHQRVLEKFTAERMTREYLELYVKVINGQQLNARPPQNGGNYVRGRLLPMQP